MADSFYKLEDESFPSFLSKSLDNSNGRDTLGNVTLGSGPGLPVAASTVAKIRPCSDNRGGLVEASYLEGGEQQLVNRHPSVSKQPNFSLSFKDDLNSADDFIAAHRFSDMLVKINLDESGSGNQASALGLPPTQMDSVHGRPTELGTELSTGLLTFAQFGQKDNTDPKVQMMPMTAEEGSAHSDGVDSDRFSGSNASFLANEKLMSVDSMNSDITDDDIDSNNLPDDELEVYFNKLMPPAMQRGRVEGQEIPATGLLVADDASNPSSPEPDQNRHHYLNDYNQEDFQMPDVRLAATGMDSCPASDEDTEDELESARRNSSSSRVHLLPSTSRQLVGESNRPSFRPGLEGGSSDDEDSIGQRGPSLSGIEHRRSAEGQVINIPVAGDGGGGDGSSGSEESGNDGGVSTIPLPTPCVQTTYDALRGLGIVGSHAVGEDDDQDQPGSRRSSLPRRAEMGDRVGPVGTGETSSFVGPSGGTQRISPVNWSAVLDRQEALDAMESTESGPTDRLLDSVYLRGGGAQRRGHNLEDMSASNLQSTQGSIHFSHAFPPECDEEKDDEGVDQPDGAVPHLGLRGSLCGDVIGAETSGNTTEDENNLLSTSLEAKYFSREQDSDDGWNLCPDNIAQEFQQGANVTHDVVYQDEEGQWVTDLAYYSSFQKEADNKASEDAAQLQSEEFVPLDAAMDKILEDQKEFEKEHQFMQEEKMEPAISHDTFNSDSSWKLPTSNSILMRASQLSSQFERGDESYLRLSLGQFFEQRSEALGCLGSAHRHDAVRRPSFGYIISSPEKREPFALIHPSDFSLHNDPMEVGETDKTLQPEDLDHTLEAPGERVSPKGDPNPHPCTKEDHGSSAADSAHREGPGSEPSLAHQSFASPDSNSSHLMLSISTIASAIADASISTDPSQLAAMIIELSKKGRSRRPPSSVGPDGNSSEVNPAGEHMLPETYKSALLDTLQSSACAGDLSTVDMEKYLKKTDVSVGSDASVAHTTFNLTAWGDGINNSQMDNHQVVQRLTISRAQEKEGDAAKANVAKASSAGAKGEPRRSSIPRPCSSSRVFAGTERSSTVKPKAEVAGACHKPSPSSERTFAVDVDNGKNRQPQAANAKTSQEASPRSSTGCSTGCSDTSCLPRTPPAPRVEQSSLTCLNGSSAPPPSVKSGDQPQQDNLSVSVEKKPTLRDAASEEKHVGLFKPSLKPTTEMLKGFPETRTEETQHNFRPSTSPLTHSSPSQTSVHSADSMASPVSPDACPPEKRPGVDLSPNYSCSSPSLSRLTYISINDGTALPTPDKPKNNCSMALSTTIIRFSPTPPVEPETQSNLDLLNRPKSLDQAQAQHSKSLDPLPAQLSQSPQTSHASSTLSCTRSQSESNFNFPGGRSGELGATFSKHPSDSGVRQLVKVDSGYCSNLNIQQSSSNSSAAAAQSCQQWGGAASVPAAAYVTGLGMPPTYPTEGLHYIPIPGLKPQCAGLVDLPHQGDVQSLLAGRSLFNPHINQHYLGPEVPMHPGGYHVGAAGNSLFGVSSTGIPSSNLPLSHLRPPSVALGISETANPHHLSRPPQSQQDMGMEKPYSQYGAEPLLTGQVVVPEELRFPHACCVGIASQTTLSLFNPSDSWQKVSITVTSLAVDGEKVDSLPYQWLIVKNKTIIGPKTTEEQKVLFIPPKAGVYQCVLTVCSWPAFAEADVAVRANIFPKRVVLVGMAENPTLEVEVSKSGCLDFGDLPAGGAKSLPLKLLNRTPATVPIRLVISANATAWRCFTLSKQPVPVACEAPQQAGDLTPVSSSSVMNHVMHGRYGESPESLMVWVHFKAPQKYSSSGEIGPADEFSARLEIEVDSPGPSHVIKCVPIRARSGTARVHAPKDLQTISVSAPLGKSSQQMLPLKNAGNIDVQLKLKYDDAEGTFSVTPEDLSLAVEEEQAVVVSFKAHGSKKYRESLLTILVLPSGPQYEVTLKGEVTTELPGKVASPTAANHVPPVLSNKQFVAWGGVTLGRAVQQKLVLRNNSTSITQQLRLLIRGQDQDCFQLQSLFSPEERLTRHGELSIRPKEDVTVHLLFAPTRVACMLAKLEIKPSVFRPSQPGVKFIIPLSGYGGTSNIILEDQRKRGDGYVAAMSDIAVGHVSKVYLCVRNTGSRAAYIKAVAFSDVPTRSLMEPTVISLAPSQFVLKERTQEVITVLMKSSQREQNLCHSAPAQLAEVCLFCGDEVSRQQFRSLLLSKPEAAHKALSENSLLKNIEFNEKFLGEENITEAFDLPQRPNEAHIFYGNMSKIVVSLLGSARTSAPPDQPAVPLSPGRRGLQPESNIPSLDVLPVKGPQGPALIIPEPNVQASEDYRPRALRKPSKSWTIHPEQLVLPAPTLNGATATSQVQIRNNTSEELSFDLSWPAHCLTITPQHGVIEPQCHLQILVSPKPSLATKPALLPWSGQIYVQCDGQQKFIKVQIRQDLALDVSAAPADATLSALPAQAASPMLPATRLSTKSSVCPQTPPAPPALVEVASKTVFFPPTVSGHTSEATLEVQNGEVETRWYLSSFAPPYVKGVDSTGGVYRATYSAFRCSGVSGTLGAHEKMLVPVAFLPRDTGDYAQFWDLECHPLSDPLEKSRIRFQLCGTGISSVQAEGSQAGNCALPKTEATSKARKRGDASSGRSSQEEAGRRGVYSPQELYTFPATQLRGSSTLKVNIRNSSSDMHELTFVKPMEPFHVKHSKYSLRSHHYLNLPVQFKPTTPGRHTGLLLIQSETSGSLVIQLTGDALP